MALPAFARSPLRAEHDSGIRAVAAPPMPRDFLGQPPSARLRLLREEGADAAETEMADTELELRAQARVGSVLRGKYRLDGVIGIGGMAVVYRAMHRNQAEFAVKMLHPELSIREDIRTRFLREGYAANSVKHPGAVLVVDDDVAEDGSAFIVMELLAGIGCEELWMQSGRRLPANVALAIAHQLLDVLASAHAKGIVHRDIKPANLFITRDGTVKVLDFGIARARDAMASHGQATGTGMLLGTPAFMAPEQALAKSSEIDGQTDVWAVGATIFSLITGTIVHEGENAPQIMVKAATQAARSLATVAQVPPQIAALVDRSLAFHKNERSGSAAELRDAIVETSMACFGEPPSRSVIARHVASLDAAMSPTAYPDPQMLAQSAAAASAAPARVSAVSAAPAFVSAAPYVSAAPAASVAPLPRVISQTMPLQPTPLPAHAPPMVHMPPRNLAGGTTASPVSSDRGDDVAPLPPRNSGRTIAIVGGAVGLVVMLAVGGFVVKSSIDSKDAARAAAAASASVAAIPSASVAPATTASATPIATDAGTTVAVGSLPIASAASAPQRPLGAPGAWRPPPIASAVPSAAPPTPPKPTAKPDCNPNYYLDSNGEKHFKPQCF